MQSMTTDTVVTRYILSNNKTNTLQRAVRRAHARESGVETAYQVQRVLSHSTERVAAPLNSTATYVNSKLHRSRFGRESTGEERLISVRRTSSISPEQPKVETAVTTCSLYCCVREGREKLTDIPHRGLRMLQLDAPLLPPDSPSTDSDL